MIVVRTAVSVSAAGNRKSAGYDTVTAAACTFLPTGFASHSKFLHTDYLVSKLRTYPLTFFTHSSLPAPSLPQPDFTLQ